MTDYLQQALRDRDYATVMEILPDLIESGEGAVFTVETLAAAFMEHQVVKWVSTDPIVIDTDYEDLAAAIIKAAKEASE